MLLSVVGAGAAPSCGQIEAADQSKARGSPRKGSTALLPVSRLPRPGDGTQTGRISVSGSARTQSLSLALGLCRGGHLVAPPEIRAVHPHAVQNGGQLACQRHLGPLQATPFGYLQPPALERAEPRRSAQDGVGGLIQRGAHHRIAHLADPTCYVGFARLILLRCQPDMRPDRLGVAEPPRIVDPPL